MREGHSRQILKRSRAMLRGTLGVPSIKFHGFASSSDMLLLYSIDVVRVKTGVPSLVTRRFDGVAIGTANFTLVYFYLESLESYPAPNCFCDVEAFERGIDVVELQGRNTSFVTVYAWVCGKPVIYILP